MSGPKNRYLYREELPTVPPIHDHSSLAVYLALKGYPELGADNILNPATIQEYSWIVAGFRMLSAPSSGYPFSARYTAREEWSCIGGTVGSSSLYKYLFLGPDTLYLSQITSYYLFR